MSASSTLTIQAPTGGSTKKAAENAASAAQAATPATRNAEDNMQRIREVAYGFFLQRGSVDGRALDDWLQAEMQVSKELGDLLEPVVAKSR